MISFPQCTVTLVKGRGSLWGRLGGRLTVQILRVLPQGDPPSPLFKRLWAYKLAQVWELIEGQLTGGRAGKMTKGHSGTLEGIGYVHYLDCGDGFTGVYIYIYIYVRIYQVVHFIW